MPQRSDFVQGTPFRFPEGGLCVAFVKSTLFCFIKNPRHLEVLQQSRSDTLHGPEKTQFASEISPVVRRQVLNDSLTIIGDSTTRHNKAELLTGAKPHTPGSDNQSGWSTGGKPARG
jgi:hypothetical protein